jgi:hypothetical protein
MAHVALADDTAFSIELGHLVRTIPHAILTAYAGVGGMEHDSRNRVFGVGVNWAALETLCIQAVITAHGQVVALGVGINAALNLPDASPMNVRRVTVLLVAGDFTGAASNAFRHVEVETVLLPFG